MKEKLISALGGFGIVLWYILSTLIYILPFVMIGSSFLMTLVFFTIQQFLPFTSIIFWVWGLFNAISGKQDFFAYIYYAATVVLFLPFFASVLHSLSKK